MSDKTKTELEEKPPQQLILNPDNPREREMLLVEREFAVIQRRAMALSQSDIIPESYQGKIANCMIAMEMASRLNTGHLEIMQNLYVIHGKPSFSSAYLIARVNTSNVLKGRLKFEMVGEKNTDEYGCIAYGTDRETNEILKSSLVTIGVAKAEGWWSKKGSKWPTMTDQMLMYRAAAFWARIYAPDAIMGMHSVEERQDITEKEINPARQQTSSVEAMLNKTDTPLIEQEKVNKATGEVLQNDPDDEEKADSEAVIESEPESNETDPGSGESEEESIILE